MVAAGDLGQAGAMNTNAESDSRQNPPPGAQQGPSGSASSPGGSDSSIFDTLRRSTVRRGDGWVGGVCAGIADRLGVDPLLVRAAFIVLGLLFGLGVVLYALAWVLLPDRAGATHLETAIRGGDGQSWVLVSAAGLVAIVGLSSGFGWGTSVLGAIWWTGLLALLALLLWNISTSGRRSSTPPGQQGHPGDARSPGYGYNSGAHTSPQPHPHPGATAGHDGPGTAVVPYTGATSPVLGEGPSREQSPDQAQAGYATWTASSPGTAGAGSPPPYSPGAGRSYTPPPPPERPAPPTRRGIGAAGSLLTLGLGIIVFAVTHRLADVQDWPGNPNALALAFTTGFLALVLIGAGIVGRTAGFISFLTVVLLPATLIAGLLPQSYTFAATAGDRQWTVSEAADQSFSLGAGRAVLDLTSLDPADLDADFSTNQAPTITAVVNAGQLVIDVPDDLTVEINAHSAVGEVRYRDSTGDRSGVREARAGLNVTNNQTLGSGDVDLVLDVYVTVGSIEIERMAG